MFKVEKKYLEDFLVDVHNVKNKNDFKVKGQWTNYNYYSYILSTLIRANAYIHDNFVYAYHYQKLRKHTKQTKCKIQDSVEGSTVTKSEIIQEAGWIVKEYKFPVVCVKSFQQYARHFDVVLF